MQVVQHGSHMDRKTWKNEKTFFSQGILNRLEKSKNFTQNIGEIREFYPKYCKSEGVLASFYFYFSLIF